MPVIMQPTDVLIKVEAVSVKPIDVAMTRYSISDCICILRSESDI